MTDKYRVHELAKDLNVPSKDIIELLNKHFETPKKHMTALTPEELNLVFEHYTQNNQVASFDEYFASGQKKKEAQAEKKEAAPAPKAAKNAPKQETISESVQKPAEPAVKEAQQEVTMEKKQNQQQGVAAPNKGEASKQKTNFVPNNNKPFQQGSRPAGQNGEKRSVQGNGQQGERRFNNDNRDNRDNRQGGQQKGQFRPNTNQPRNAGGQSSKGNNAPAKKAPIPAAAPPRPVNTAPVTPPPDEKTASGRSFRHVDMRAANVDLDKYNERYETIAPVNMAKKDTGVKKQKFGNKNSRKPFMSKKDKEMEKLKRLEMERQRRQKLHITIPDEITVGDLALRLKVQAAEVIKKLMALGVMASVSEVIDYDTAAMVAMEIGAKVEREVVITLEERLFDDTEDSDDNLVPRPPVVVVMGHVDHGKTSILDAIRKADIAAGEAGGITQHIGAYQVTVNNRPITFLDTPGHEAFTSMRARGAKTTDIAILVVAADDGIMPQTIESINHAKAAEVSIIVAINKMDKPTANAEKVKQELTEYGLVPEEWGGDIICVPVSAKTGEGLEELLEMVLLTADVKELKANPDRQAKGTVIEARLDKGRGPIATVLVQTGTLHTGDAIIAGTAVGRVRVMTNDRGEKLETAGPSMPVEITGLAEVPSAGDIFNAVEDERLARELVEQRKAEAKEEQFKSYNKVTLENLFSQIAEGEMKELPIIVKADVQGSAEAVKQSLEKISNEEVRVKVIHSGVGTISKSDVMLANASNAIIVGFNVRPDSIVKEEADREGVDIRLYRIIYDAINEITDAMKGMLSPKFRDVELGKAEIRQVYKITNVGMVAGAYVTEGKITRNSKIRVVRDGIIVADVELNDLKRFKDSVKEVAKGFECGMSLVKYADIKEGDIFEAYITEEYRD